jgi:hypothetical protein
MALLTTPGVGLQPANEQVALPSNYITNFDFLNQYLPDVYEKEFARYGDRTVSSFLRYTSSEMPSDSDLIKWNEDGRLHVKYVDCISSDNTGDPTATITVNDTLNPGNGGIAIRKGQTVMIFANDGTGSNKAIVTDVDLQAGEFDVAYYEAAGQTFDDTSVLSVFIYGSEFKKGTTGMEGFNEAQPDIYENSPVILKDNYTVSGSDMAQIGWVNITGEGSGIDGYYWYIKSNHETRLRFEDYLETMGLEHVPAEPTSGAAVQTVYDKAGNKGSEGVFYVVGNRGNVWAAGNPTSMADWDEVLKRLDKQGNIQENCVFMNRDFSLDTDDVLAAQNSYGAGGTSYGVFSNSKEMALNLGFSGFRRGSYDFYKTDWKYLNDPTMRGGMPTSVGSGRINGMLVPCGTKSVYDSIAGKKVTLPFLHVRYRASQAENRKMKTWITGSAGGASNSDLDAMQVNFLSERCVVTLGANNFMLFQS